MQTAQTREIMGMPFNWVRFLDEYRIDYSTRGHSRGNIGIQCPWCGRADRGHHLGISLSGKGYHCWRQQEHGGRDPRRLIQTLIGVTYASADRIYSEELAADSPYGSFDLKVDVPVGSVREQRVLPKPLKLLPEFFPIADCGLGRTWVLPYLTGRGYSFSEALVLARWYDLHYAFQGRFACRVIFPVTMHGALMNWTARAFAGQYLRYDTLTTNSETAQKQGLPTAPCSLKDCVFDYDYLSRAGGTLVLTEGPFDAARISWLGFPYEVHGTCTFGKNITAQQIALLRRLSRRFDHCYALADADAQLDLLPAHLQGIFEWLKLPNSVQDPAELRPEDFLQMMRICLEPRRMCV